MGHNLGNIPVFQNAQIFNPFQIQNGRHFWQFFAHKMPKNKNFKNRLARSLELHTRKVHAKYQVPSMYGVQMNGTLVFSRYRDLKFARV